MLLRKNSSCTSASQRLKLLALAAQHKKARRNISNKHSLAKRAAAQTRNRDLSGNGTRYDVRDSGGRWP
jgi:hypothetical protein